MTDRTLTAAMRQFFQTEKERAGTVRGNSMAPALADGQKVTVVGCRGPFSPGHCYVFYHNGRLVLHRLVFQTATAAYFAGDNLSSVEKVPLEHVVCELRSEYGPARLFPVVLVNWLFLFVRKLPVANRFVRALRAWWIYFILGGGLSHERTL